MPIDARNGRPTLKRRPSSTSDDGDLAQAGLRASPPSVESRMLDDPVYKLSFRYFLKSKL
jgi:hypothetical protein